MGAAVPCPPLALDEAEDVRRHRNVTHVVDDVLEPPLLHDLALVDGADRVVGHEAGLVGLVSPRLLVVHDVGDFVVVRPRTVLLDVIAPGRQGLDLVVGEDGGVGVDDRVVVELTFVAD